MSDNNSIGSTFGLDPQKDMTNMVSSESADDILNGRPELTQSFAHLPSLRKLKKITSTWVTLHIFTSIGSNSFVLFVIRSVYILVLIEKGTKRNGIFVPKLWTSEKHKILFVDDIPVDC